MQVGGRLLFLRIAGQGFLFPRILVGCPFSGFLCDHARLCDTRGLETSPAAWWLLVPWVTLPSLEPAWLRAKTAADAAE